MEILTSEQRDKLIHYKNKLYNESEYAYTLASIEEEKTTELILLNESSIKEKIAKEIEHIIYDKFQ